LHPDVRKGRTCVEFAKYSENVVRQLGVREIRLSVKVTNDIWKLWERIGYQRTGYELVKVLEG
jgi:ribosomal protein S18 acetylase RimI-like enzyme